MLRYLSLLIFLLQSVVFNSQTQIGSDIVGEFLGDQSGERIAISGNGEVVAVPARFNDTNGDNSGNLRVFEYLNGDWVQKGSTFYDDEPKENDRFGLGVSLNYDGTIIAIGDRGDTADEEEGKVVVYEFIGNDWTLKGEEILSNTGQHDGFGFFVELNDAGNILLTSNGIFYGAGDYFARAYKFENGSWVQLGTDISFWPGAVRDMLDINATGDVIAVSGTISGYPDAVAVFQFSEDDWVQMGDYLEGDPLTIYFGADIALNALGDIVAISDHTTSGPGFQRGRIDIFQYVDGNWISKGQPIFGEYDTDKAKIVELNDDGNILAVTSINNNEGAFRGGAVRIFQFISGDWTQIGEPILGEQEGAYFGEGLSINSLGTRIAVSSSTMNDFTGITRVFDLSGILGNNTPREQDIFVYPNPSKNVLKISNFQLGDKVYIYDVMGKKLHFESLERNEINIESFQNGVYMLKLIRGDASLSTYFIKN